METRSIKGIDARTWAEFKALAVKKRQTMGKLLAEMVRKHAKSADEFWNEVLSGKKIISDEEAKEMHTITKKLRKEKGFRNVSDS